MEDHHDRMEFVHSFHRRYKSLFDKSEETERLIVAMKRWCDDFSQKVRQHFSASVGRKYLKETERMKDLLGKTERAIQTILDKIGDDATLADDTFNLFDPEATGLWLKMEKNAADYGNELDLLLNLFYVIMGKFNEFKKRVEEECREMDSSF